MTDYFNNWMLGLAALAAILSYIGFLSGRKLEPIARKKRLRKFAAIGLAIFFFGISAFEPYVSPHSYAEDIEEVKPKNLDSMEELVKFANDQSQYIHQLKKDIVELKSDVYKMNRFYSAVTRFLTTVIAVIFISFAFRKKDEVSLEEIDENNILKL